MLNFICSMECQKRCFLNVFEGGTVLHACALASSLSVNSLRAFFLPSGAGVTSGWSLGISNGASAGLGSGTVCPFAWYISRLAHAECSGETTLGFGSGGVKTITSTGCVSTWSVNCASADLHSGGPANMRRWGMRGILLASNSYISPKPLYLSGRGFIHMGFIHIGFIHMVLLNANLPWNFRVVHLKPVPLTLESWSEINMSAETWYKYIWSI